ncbi:MAG: GWxTD domain-containing protein [Bacteroidota bacterium]|nr:GWxTD domain-containing protein [Bacteroidota bacterium]
MKRIIFLLFSIFQLSRIGVCDEEIYFNFDYAVFQDEEGIPILEVYYSVNQKSLKYLKVGSNFEAAAKINISVVDNSNKNEIISNSYKTPSVVGDTSDEKVNRKLVGQINYSLPAGSYRLKITGTDFNDSSKKDSLEKEVIITKNETGKIRISDIELSTLINKAQNDKSIFYKNTLDVIPNPSALFGMNLKELYYYFEIYGLNKNNISETFNINYDVTNLNSEPIISHKKRAKRKGESKADYGKIKIDSLPRGSYLLKVSITDSLEDVKSFAEKKFFIFNNVSSNSSSIDQNDFLTSEYAIMSEKDVNDEYEKMIYVMSDDEYEKFELLKSLNDKRKYLFSFWKSKDSNPNSPILETKIKYFKRVDEANKMYKESFGEGWKTDRGRILIIYGKPDDIESHPLQTDKKSYEVWKYNSVQGGGECVFVELQPMTGVYWIVTSTFRDELRNENWESQLEI